MCMLAYTFLYIWRYCHFLQIVEYAVKSVMKSHDKLQLEGLMDLNQFEDLKSVLSKLSSGAWSEGSI